MTTVLIVEDEWAIADALEAGLVDLGFIVVTAANGQAALACMAEAKPDIILTDYMMPVMGGAALIAAVQTDPDLRTVPIVVMSSMPEERVAAEASGYAAYVAKPFLFGTITEAIHRVLATGPG